jgi:hypothetical protein
LTSNGLRRIVRILLVLLALLPGIGFGRSFHTMFSLPGNIDPFTDANTYLAAGERLNAGRSLYALGPGDRPVLIVPGQFSAPLVSPPTIATMWRPFAALPFGFQLWLLAAWVALLGAVAWIVYWTGVPGLVLALVLAEPIGNQLSIGNVTSFFPALLIVIWNCRGRPWVAALISLMTAIKIAPGVLFGRSRISRHPRWIAWAVGSMAVILGVTAIGSGPGSFVEYLGVAGSTNPSPLSLSGLTGISWMTFAVLVAGTIVAALLRNEAWSFVVAVIAMVAGTPSLYLAGLVPLLAVLAPLAERNRREAPTLFGWMPRIPRMADWSRSRG